MSNENDIEEVRRARVVAEALRGGDIDALIELSDVLEASGTPEKIRSFVLQLLFELCPTQQGKRWQALSLGKEGAEADLSPRVWL